MNHSIPKSLQPDGTPHGARHAARRRTVATAIGGACLLGAISWLFGVRAAAVDPPTPAVAEYTSFSHTNGHHARLACLLCHRREDNAPRPKLPGHAPCAGCHSAQFADRGSPICAICHTNPPAAPVKDFPDLKTFNVLFDHAKHLGGQARPRAGCATCHKPDRRGVGLSIPDGQGAHATCFQCHSPRAQAGGRDLSSCGVCHRLGRYAPTPEFSQAYRANFSHAEHANKGLGCNACHTVLRTGLGQRRQVSSPYPSQHHAPARTTSCQTCHDNNRAFGGDDFSDCKRCHRGDTWHF